jgi:hypothetical protein
MAKPMNSGGSSAFWFQQDETPGWATEIDVQLVQQCGINPQPDQQPQINLLILAGHADTHLAFPEDFYRTWEDMAKPVLPARGPDRQSWLRVDQRFARRISRGR